MPSIKCLNLIRQVWDRNPAAKRGELARALGYKSEWGRLSYGDLGRRGGGMLKKDLNRLYGKWCEMKVQDIFGKRRR